MPLGQPSIPTPGQMQLQALQQLANNVRERFGAVEAEVNKVLNASTQNTRAVQVSAAGMAAIQRQIDDLVRAIQGLEDAMGGEAGAAAVYEAAEDLPKAAPVWVSAQGVVSLIDPDDPLRSSGYIGVTTEAATTGQKVTVRSRGVVELDTAFFTPGAQLYAGDGGALTHAPAGNALPVGVATSASSLSVGTGTLALSVVPVSYEPDDSLPVTYRLARYAIELALSFELAASPGPSDGWVLTWSDALQAYVPEPPSGGAPVWGTITGTLSDQLDLQAALDTKQDVATLAEAIDDRVHGLLVAGAGIILVYDDVLNTLTISAPGGGGSGSTWGAITGTLSDQVDLQAALDLKLNAADFDPSAFDAAGSATAAVAAHVAAADPHPQYTTDTEATTIAGAAVAAHVAAANPHTQYVLTASLSELVDDRVAALLVAGSNITLTYNDASNTLTIASTGGGGAAWGSITGTLSAQTDLQAALDAKLNASAVSPFGLTLIDDANAAAAQATLGLVPGTNVQAQDAELQAIAGLASAANQVPYFTGSGTAALAPFTVAGRALVNSAGTANTFPYFSAANVVTLAPITPAGLTLLDDADAAAQRTTLGLGNQATKANADLSITDDTTTAVAVYPTWYTGAAASGVGGEFITTTRFSFIPSTGVLQTSGGIRTGGGSSSNTLQIGGQRPFPSGMANPAVYVSDATGPSGQAGHVMFEARSDLARGFYFYTGTTPILAFGINPTGTTVFAQASTFSSTINAAGAVTAPSFVGDLTGRANSLLRRSGTDANADLVDPATDGAHFYQQTSSGTNGPVVGGGLAALTVPYSSTVNMQLGWSGSRLFTRQSAGSVYPAWSEVSLLDTASIFTAPQIIREGAGSGVAANSVADNFVIDSNATNAGLSILGTSTCRIGFGNLAQGAIQGQIVYATAAGNMTFNTAGTTAMGLDAVGNMNVVGAVSTGGNVNVGGSLTTHGATALGAAGDITFGRNATDGAMYFGTDGDTSRYLFGNVATLRLGPTFTVFRPGAAATSALGSPSFPWTTVYADRLAVGGNAAVADLASGTYTPTLTNIANVVATTARTCSWTRVGDVVTVGFTADIDPNAANTYTQLRISLPVPSNFTSFSHAQGSATRNAPINLPFVSGTFQADAANDAVILSFLGDVDISSRAWMGNFQYFVL